jgi:ketosteroid isomerase-like protein
VNRSTNTSSESRIRKVMTGVDEFFTKTLARQVEAEEALHNGDPDPRLRMWSTEDPVTLFGAWGPCKSGSAEVVRISRWVASRFSNCHSYSFELIASGVGGDLAYTVGYEHSTRSVDGGPVERSTLRVTHVYRREQDEWKVVHRHADLVPLDQSPPAEKSKPYGSDPHKWSIDDIDNGR